MCWQESGIVSNDSGTALGKIFSSSECLSQINMLKQKLSKERTLRNIAEEQLAKLASKDILAHCKGLEKTLARQHKKTSALEAINEALRQQLARQNSVSTEQAVRDVRAVSAPDALTSGCIFSQRYALGSVLEGADSHASDEQKHVAHYIGEKTNAQKEEKVSVTLLSTGKPVPENTRTWSRFSAAGVLSPCKKSMCSTNQARGMTITPVRGAQAWLERAVNGQWLARGGGADETKLDYHRDRSINDRSISFVAEV